MSKIKDLPFYERPREKAQRFGIDKVSDAELLAIIIGSGTKGFSALEIAHQIIKENNGLYKSSLVGLEEYQNHKGISLAIATKIAAVFELAKRTNLVNLSNDENSKNTQEFILEKYRIEIAGLQQEILVIVFLDKKKRIIKEKKLYVGTNNGSLISTREIIKELFISNASFFYLLHNHPNGTPYPSDDDIKATVEILKMTKEIGIDMIDHFIISSEFCYSFKETRCI